MSPRTGRPKAENPKKNDVKVRIDDKTSKLLDAYCDAHGITRAEAIRQGIHLLLAQKK
ncbi:MAG: ribbon-helix-helix protein, CopG family [Oscillospiraceae bacterium]|nr:ribbon-helix-helix protein, CopG family [Oscillospiraceae bacterium]